MASKYGDAVARMDAARHLILTVPSVDAPLADQLKQIRASMRRLRQQRVWGQVITGGVYSIEITRNAKTGLWHPHVHLVVDGSYIVRSEMAAAWEAALKSSSLWRAHGLDDGVIVYITAVHARHQLARYISKYVAKPQKLSSWPPRIIAEYALAVSKTRMMHTFGRLHGVQLGGDEPNESPAVATTLIGLSELDWRDKQGYPAAKAAVALLRAMVPVCSCWLGAPRDAPLDAWASGVGDPTAELKLQLGALSRQVATGPPGAETRSAAQIRAQKIELRSRQEPLLIDESAARRS